MHTTTLSAFVWGLILGIPLLIAFDAARDVLRRHDGLRGWMLYRSVRPHPSRYWLGGVFQKFQYKSDLKRWRNRGRSRHLPRV